MMLKKTGKLSVFLLIFFCGSCMSNAQKFRNIKYFNTDLLKTISTKGYYQCIGVYFSDKNYKIIKELSHVTSRILKFKENGFIESNALPSNDNGYSGVLYLKNNKMKIDLSGGTSDGGKIVRTYNLKIEGDKLHLLEDNIWMSRELIYFIYERRAN